MLMSCLRRRFAHTPGGTLSRCDWIKDRINVRSMSEGAGGAARAPPPRRRRRRSGRRRGRGQALGQGQELVAVGLAMASGAGGSSTSPVSRSIGRRLALLHGAAARIHEAYALAHESENSRWSTRPMARV